MIANALGRHISAAMRTKEFGDHRLARRQINDRAFPREDDAGEHDAHRAAEFARLIARRDPASPKTLVTVAFAGDEAVRPQMGQGRQDPRRRPFPTHSARLIVTIGDGEKVEGFRQKKLTPELPGILNWMLLGLKDHLAGGLRPPAVVSNATKEYRHEMDSVGRWIDAACEPSNLKPPLGCMTLKAIHEVYAAWAEIEQGWIASASCPLVTLEVDGMSNRAFCNLRASWR
jgi:hypothetical protein